MPVRSKSEPRRRRNSNNDKAHIDTGNGYENTLWPDVYKTPIENTNENTEAPTDIERGRSRRRKSGMIKKKAEKDFTSYQISAIFRKI